MYPVYFDTPGQLDVRAMTTFGLSAKEGENPIGFFGTGLKYAIAIIMRHRGNLTVQSADGEHYNFDVTTTEFRDQEFDAITMNGKEMPFTTHLGANWKMWMAYRELYCNTKDEKGHVHTGDKAAGSNELPEGWTRISVIQPEFYSCHRNRHEYFIEDEWPIHSYAMVEMYKGTTDCIYYKGVRAHKLQFPAMYRYNYTGAMDLTEDRTLMSTWIIDRRIPRVIAHCDDRDIIRKFVTAQEGYYESKLCFDPHMEQTSQEFLHVMKGLAHDKTGRVNRSAQELYRNLTKKPGDHDYEEVELTSIQQKQFNKAMRVCEDLGYDPYDWKILFVKTIGNGILGCVEDDRIFLTIEVFESGTKMVAGTLMEELIHAEYGVSDYTRGMQNMLINKIMTMYEAQTGEPL